MSDDFDDDGYWDWARDEAEALLIKEGIENQRDEQIRDYLGVYGDAVQARIGRCIADSRRLLENGFSSSSLVQSVTATELAIHHFILRPILSGAFLSERWAEILVKRVLTQRSSSDRELLPAVLQAWGIDLNSLGLPSGRALWPTFVTDIVPTRNAVVHQGLVAPAENATLALEIQEGFLTLVVAPLSDRFGFSWSVTRVWAEVRWGVGGATFSRTFQSLSPFGD